MSSFSSISTAMTALQAHRRALDVTGHNIANVNTAGYTRQRVDLQPRQATGASSVMANSGLTGAGVEVLGTTRLADEFLTARVRSQTSSHAELRSRAETLTQVERLLDEPGDTGLSKQLSAMWAAWSTLGNNPDTLGAKTVVLDKTQAVIDSVRAGSAAVATLRTNQHTQAEALVTEVNTLSTQIAGLNGAVAATSKDGSANELLDQRDQLVTRLVELTGATVVAAEDGLVNIYLGGVPAVAGVSARTIVVDLPASGAGAGAVGLRWSDGDAVAPLRGGQLAGVLDSVNTTLPGVSATYDAIALELRDTVNAGYAPAAAGSFLSGTGAGDLRLTSTDPAAVRAGAPNGGAKDGSVAAAVGERRTQPLGPDALWQKHVVGTGVRVQASTARADVLASTLATAVADQQSAVGVSLDEETANLLVVQRAYEAAARVLTSVDQALDTLINRTGLVGR